MIKGLFIINTHGKPRLTKYYDNIPHEDQARLLRDVYSEVSKRPETACNFLEGTKAWGDVKVIYRQYATLYFVLVVDRSESELAILDLIHIFVETLDRSFEKACELDIVFHMDKVHYIVDEMVQGGMVLDTSKESIIRNLADMKQLEKVSAKTNRSRKK
eukprot:gb/GECH01013071.1/.p1 GENE.gb/GECH01013071.1/~~gb/GECH01013071.1/.p1  ORF type:complete len:159 (+),score=15.12 gb/GECH01013071.1/:1-477(+)